MQPVNHRACLHTTLDRFRDDMAPRLASILASFPVTARGWSIWRAIGEVSLAQKCVCPDLAGTKPKHLNFVATLFDWGRKWDWQDVHRLARNL